MINRVLKQKRLKLKLEKELNKKINNRIKLNEEHIDFIRKWLEESKGNFITVNKIKNHLFSEF